MTTNKTLRTIGKIYGGFAIASLAVGTVSYFVLRYTDKKTEAKVMSVWNTIKHDVIKDLGLNVMPTLAFDGANSGALMHVSATTHYTRSLGDFFNQKITKQESDNVIHINIAAISKMITDINISTMRDLSDPIIRTLFRHECRHLHQFQTGFKVGTVENVLHINSMLDGYGEEAGEHDANIYAIDAATNKTERLVAELSKAIQDEAGKMFPDNSKINEYMRKLNRFA